MVKEEWDSDLKSSFSLSPPYILVLFEVVHLDYCSGCACVICPPLKTGEVGVSKNCSKSDSLFW